jgi:UDP-4-amino-4,6-dideoxy-N-acetyl-beta-L-altrosamine N-acetyltransferase
MKLTGKIISLIPLHKKHLPLMVKWRNNPSVSEMMFDHRRFTLKKQLKWFETIKGDSSRKQFIIIENKGGKPIGAINLMSIDKKNGNCDWGYYIGEDDYRMGGYSVEAEYLILKYAFETLDMHKVYCQTFSYNKKVISNHAKFGFTTDGIMRQHYKIKEGYADIFIMSILKEEFWSAAGTIEQLLNIFDR